MKIELLPVLDTERLSPTIYALHFRSEYIAKRIAPGQFVNIKVSDDSYPLLRRPFSIARRDGDVLTILFEVVGLGTRILSRKRPGDLVDVLGPLGRPFTLPSKGSTAVLIAGGLGIAPMPILTQNLLEHGITSIETFFGARTKDYLVDYHLKNVHYATDDNTKGFHGTVVSLLDSWLNKTGRSNLYFYACGPAPMLRAVQTVLQKHRLHGQVSLECTMACGVGICQGCPVESVNSTKRYRLVCKDGPVFDIHSVIIE